MSPSPPTQAMWKKALLRLRRLSVGCHLSGDVKSSASPSSTPHSSSLLSPSTFATSPPAACSPHPPSAIVQRCRSTAEATQHQSISAKSNTVTESWRPRSNSVVVHGAGTATAPARGAPTASLFARRHLFGECVAHPSGCDCEKVQLPTMDSSKAWHVMSLRFKAAGSPAVCAPPSADAPLYRWQSEPLLHRTNPPHVDNLREGERRIDRTISSNAARSTGPAVLAVPSRFAQRLKRLQRVECARELYLGPNKSWPPRTRTHV